MVVQKHLEWEHLVQDYLENKRRIYEKVCIYIDIIIH